jgi:hypothetical protein
VAASGTCDDAPFAVGLDPIPWGAGLLARSLLSWTVMRRVLPLVLALALAAGEAHARPCGRWTATLLSDSGAVATIRMRVRHCDVGARPAHVPGGCKGRYRCHGEGCLARRGTFVTYGTLMNFNPTSRRRPFCSSRPDIVSASAPYRYFCQATDGTVVDQGTFSCETRVACKGSACPTAPASR